MTELIQEPIKLKRPVVGKPTNHNPMPKVASRPLHLQPFISAIGIAAILATALYLSVQSNYLFFKELLIACSIIGMAILVKVLGHSKNTANSTDDTFDSRLN